MLAADGRQQQQPNLHHLESENECDVRATTGTHLSLALDEPVFDDAQCRDDLLPESFDAADTVARSLRGAGLWLRAPVSASLLLLLRGHVKSGEKPRPGPTHLGFSQGGELLGGERLHRLNFVVDTLLLQGASNRCTSRQRRRAQHVWGCRRVAP